MMITNEQSFIAACVHNQNKVPKRFESDNDYYYLKHTKKNGQVVVASSGWNQDGREDIPNCSAITIDKKMTMQLV